jgi:hypothetical protein
LRVARPTNDLTAVTTFSRDGLGFEVVGGFGGDGNIEDAVLAAAAFVEEYQLTPFDALHAGVAATRGERVLSSERDYDTVGLDRTPLEPDTAE